MAIVKLSRNSIQSLISLLFSPCYPLPISTCIKFAEISSALDNMYRAPVSRVPVFGISLYLLYISITCLNVSCPATGRDFTINNIIYTNLWHNFLSAVSLIDNRTKPERCRIQQQLIQSPLIVYLHFVELSKKICFLCSRLAVLTPTVVTVQRSALAAVSDTGTTKNGVKNSEL